MATVYSVSESKPEEKPSIFKRFGELMSSIFLPILTPLIGAGLLQGIMSILTTTRLLPTNTNEYFILNTISTAVFYFIPFLLAGSTANAFGALPYLALGVTAVFLHPDMVAAMSGNQALNFLGIPIAKTQYTSSVLPIILIIWIMSHIERLGKRIVPPKLRTILVPASVLLLTCLLGLIVVGPIGSLLIQGVVAVVRYLNTNISWLVPTLTGALARLLIMVGITFSLFPVALQSIAVLGYETVYSPGMIATMFALAGMSVAVARKTNSGRYKSYSLSATLTAVLGVAQPSLYGIALPLRRPLFAVMIAGGIGGLIAGLSGFRVYTLVPPGVVALAGAIGDAGFGNLIWGVVIMAVSFGAAFILTDMIGFDEPSPEVVEEVVGRQTGGGDDAEQDSDKNGAGKGAAETEPSGKENGAVASREPESVS